MMRRRYIYDNNLQLPPAYQESDSLRELSKTIIGDEILPLNKAKAVETYLRENFEYTLENQVVDTNRLVEEFLFRTKAGHCEYFATSMAVLLRLQDVPTRIVNGFYTDEFSNLGNYFVVRQEHAHAWVEVFEDGIGWVTFDPTPPMGVGSGRFDANPILVRIGYLYDALITKWYKYVVDYNYMTQRKTYQVTGRAVDRVKQLPRKAVENRVAKSFLYGAAMGALILLGAWILRRLGSSPQFDRGMSGVWRRLRVDLRRVLEISTPDVALSDREILETARAARYRSDAIGRAVLLHEATTYGVLEVTPEDLMSLKNLRREVRRDIRQLKK